MDKYERAQDRIAEGSWIVDVDNGQVYSSRGKALGSATWCGYVFLSMAPEPGSRSNQNVYAHRVIYERAYGPIPDGMQVNHINGIKSDNRIANLELVTPSGNTLHAYRTGLAVSRKGEANGRAKLTTSVAEAIRARAANGERQQDIANDVGISRQHVGRIVRGERWVSAA